jgi:hypothetical protein
LNISGKTSKSFDECMLITAITKDVEDSITRKTNKKGSTTWNVDKVETMLKNLLR